MRLRAPASSLDASATKYQVSLLITSYHAQAAFHCEDWPDAGALADLFAKMKAEITENGEDTLYNEIEFPLAQVLADMTRTGVLVDKAGIEAFGGQLAVPDDAAAPVPGGHGLGVERGRVEHVQRHGRVVQQGNQLFLAQGVDGGVLHGIPVFRFQNGVFLAQHCRTGSQQEMPGTVRRQGGYRALRDRGRLGGGRRGDIFQPEPGDEGLEFQLLHQAHGGGLVALADLVGPLGGVDGGIGADGAQHMAQLGVGPVLQQVFPLLGLDGLVVDVGIDAFQVPELLYQGQGGLFADALHAGDVVGRVAHQTLDLDQLQGLDAVFLPDGIRVHGDRFAAAHGAGGQQHRGGVADQLQAVTVSGGQIAVIFPGGAGGGQGAQDVIGFPALGGDLPVTQVGEQLFEDGHLLGQLVGHGLPGGLVAVVHLVPEGGGPQVERHGHFIGLAAPEQGVENIQKAENGVGIAAVLGGQQLDAVEGAVGNTVAVNDQ